jgi:hypothetical protein
VGKLDSSLIGGERKQPFTLPEAATAMAFKQCTAEYADDCRDAGGRATQEQLPRTQRSEDV